MTSVLKEKINHLNLIVDSYQRGFYTEDEFKKALANKLTSIFRIANEKILWKIEKS